MFILSDSGWAVFHAYLVYLLTHILSTSAGDPRIFGLLLRINCLHAVGILLILSWMRLSLYTCMRTLYE